MIDTGTGIERGEGGGGVRCLCTNHKILTRIFILISIQGNLRNVTLREHANKGNYMCISYCHSGTSVINPLQPYPTPTSSPPPLLFSLCFRLYAIRHLIIY